MKVRVKFIWADGLWLKESKDYSITRAMRIIQWILKTRDTSIIEEGA